MSTHVSVRSLPGMFYHKSYPLSFIPPAVIFLQKALISTKTTPLCTALPLLQIKQFLVYCCSFALHFVIYIHLYQRRAHYFPVVGAFALSFVSPATNSYRLNVIILVSLRYGCRRHRGHRDHCIGNFGQYIGFFIWFIVVGVILIHRQPPLPANIHCKSLLLSCCRCIRFVLRLACHE